MKILINKNMKNLKKSERSMDNTIKNYQLKKIYNTYSNYCILF